MISTIPYLKYPNTSIAPVVVYTITFLVLCLLLLMRPSTRNAVGFSALVGALSGLVYNAIIMEKFLGYSYSPGTAAPASLVFYGICISFAFVPGLIGFHRISKANGKTVDKCVVYFGYFWTFVTIVMGLTLTIFTAVNRGNDFHDSYGVLDFIKVFSSLNIFMYASGWAFVAVYLYLIGSNFGALARQTRNTLFFYTLLNVISVLVITICFNIRVDSISKLQTVFIVGMIFSDIPIPVALIIATYYGNTWNYKIDEIPASSEFTEDISKLNA